jgi:hypothetical protein
MLIQVDVDSTLYPFDELCNRVTKEQFGLDWPVSYSHWFGPDEIGTDLDTMKKIFRVCHSREYVLQNTPYPDAVDVLKGIADDFSEVEIAYVSDRNEQQGKALREWLDQEGFLMNPDQHVAATKDKRHWMREKRPEIVIDDRVRTMLMARYELGSYVVSLEHAHNINLKGEAPHIYIEKDWKSIDKVLRDIIIPKVQEQSLSRSKTRPYELDLVGV